MVAVVSNMQKLPLMLQLRRCTCATVRQRGISFMSSGSLLTGLDIEHPQAEVLTTSAASRPPRVRHKQLDTACFQAEGASPSQSQRRPGEPHRYRCGLHQRPARLPAEHTAYVESIYGGKTVIDQGSALCTCASSAFACCKAGRNCCTLDSTE